MIDELTYAKEMLIRGGYSLVVCSGGYVYTSSDRGIKPLLEIVDDESLKNCYASDKIVGKAAAMLYVLLKAEAVYAEVMSADAVKVFENYGIKFEYKELTDKIINRDKSGLCPMELAVKDIDAPQKAREAIEWKIKTLAS